MKQTIAIFLFSFILISPIAFQKAYAADSVAKIFDVDGNGDIKPLSDGLLMLRYLFGFRGDSLISKAIGKGASRKTASQIETYLSEHTNDLDIDGNGEVKPLSDGLLLLRYSFGFRGDSLVDKAIGKGAARTTAEQIANYIVTGGANSGEKVKINLDSATQISRTQLTGDMRTILLTEKHIFLAAGEAGLHTLSRNNNNPSIISTLAINDYALSIQLSSDNEILFIAADTGGLAIVDVTTPSKGKLLASIETNYIAEDIAVSDDNKYVYIADGEAGVTVVDISNLHKPILRGNISIPNHGYAHGIKLSRDNKHVFVASTFGGLNIFDVSDPDSPLFVSQIDTGDKAYSLVLSQDENTAFVASGKAGIAVINITNKKLPSRIGSWNDTPPIVDEFYPINAMDLKLLSDQTTILVATGAAGIYRVDVTKKNLPVTMDFVDTPDRATRFVLSEDESKLFVSSGVFSLLIYDVSIQY